MNSEFIILLANLALTLSFIVGLIFGIVQMRAAGRDRKERLTLDALRRFETRDFAELLYHINSYEIPATYDEWQKMPAKDQVMFIQLSQEMENLGLLVAERFINIDLVDKTLGSFVVTAWEKFQKVIQDMREKLPDPFLSEYFQWLAEQINECMEKCPREPFYKNQQSRFRL